MNFHNDLTVGLIGSSLLIYSGTQSRINESKQVAVSTRTKLHKKIIRLKSLRRMTVTLPYQNNGVRIIT